MALNEERLYTLYHTIEQQPYLPQELRPEIIEVLRKLTETEEAVDRLIAKSFDYLGNKDKIIAEYHEESVRSIAKISIDLYSSISRLYDETLVQFDDVDGVDPDAGLLEEEQ